jgi:uncharacterized membrane protein YdjX (TVP38/TMEM64 family)
MDTSLTETVMQFLQRWGELTWTSAFVVAALLVALSLVPIPRVPVHIAIGAAFGFWSIPLIMVSNATGAALAFLLSRYCLFDRLQRFADERPRLRALLDAIDSEGWRFVALLRLGSGVPGVMQNYMFGLTRIPLWTCTIMMVFTVPAIMVHVYLGTIGRHALESKAADIDLAIQLVTAVVVVSVVTLIVRRMRVALRSG